MRIDAPGAIISIAPPRTVAVFGAMAALFVALVLLAVFGRAQIVAEGRGVVRPDHPSIVLRAPFAGIVVAVRRKTRERGGAGDLLIEMDAHTESAGHEKCSGVVAAEQKELASLQERLSEWNDAGAAGHDAALALVLITQIRAQREKVNGDTARCDALGAVVERSRVTFPVDARVVDLAVTSGSHVHEGDTLATLDGADSGLVGYMQLAERYRSEVNVGQTVRTKFDALPFDEVGAGSAHVTHVLEALPSGVKVEGPEGGVFLELSLDAMPSGVEAPRGGMTFTGDVLTRRTRILSLLFGSSDDDG
jgi:multidrug efflux pump subunit AcrA (membrane-fusion protein)